MKSAAVVDQAPPRVRGHATREQVLRLLLSEGPATAAALAARLGLTTAGVRRHLDGMVADGTLVGREPRGRSSRGRGRPPRVYALTDAGHARAQHAYDDLAADALSFLTALGAVEDFAAARADDLRARYAADVPRGGTAALAHALSSDGYAATVHDVPTGAQICQHHCPVAGVAARFPQLCEAETAAFSALLGQHVQRLATIAHGDGVCTTHVPAVSGGAHHPSTRPRKGAS